MSVATRMTEQEYRDLALRDPQGQWELWDGVPREKPPMSWTHGDAMTYLAHDLIVQLDPQAYRVRANHARARVSSRNYYIPDVAVIPAAAFPPRKEDPGTLDAYAGPLPLVVEIWSPSTGEYDVAAKLRGYEERGDREIWFLHPYERRLTIRRRRPDGGYDETAQVGGIAPAASLPRVTIDLDALLDG